MRAKLGLIIGCLAILASLTAMPPAEAFDQMTMATIGPNNPHVTKTYPPIAGIYPHRGTTGHPFAGFRPPTCRTVNYCDSVSIEVDFTDAYAKETFFGAAISLEWENHRTEENATGNDVDLFLWGDDGPAAGGPATKCAAPNAPECQNLHPEAISITEPDRTVDDDPVACRDDPGTCQALHLTIVNDSGVNSGYTITVDWFEFELEPPPAFDPPDRETSAQATPRVSGPFDFDVTGPRTTDDEDGPKATPRTILVPGPDGKLHEIDLPVYAAGQRLEGTAEENRLNPFIPAAIVGVVALAVLTWYLRIRSRRRADY